MKLYAVKIKDVAVSAAQDLFGLLATGNMAFRIVKIELGQRTLTSWEAKNLQLRINPATATVGSGGSAATPEGVNAAGRAVAATATARINDTTAQTTTGTQNVVDTRCWEFLNGFYWTPTSDERAPVIKPNEGFALNLPNAPSGSMNVSGSLWFEELF